ncbi:alpha-hydroxy acid oxidase [Povalibacter sp.]|uniref:alpha-hydroxy acid oxidase n=1 Tax=Povalibacter sp. TaxID=1962978 RepID=UPI002F40536A
MSHRQSPSPVLSSIPAEVRCARDYEVLARRFIAEPAYEYIAGGSGEGITLAANFAASASLTVCPRLLRDVTAGHTRLSLAGRGFSHPILLAPVAFQALVHPGAEVETARAAAATDSCIVSSTLSSCTLEEIARAAGSNKWFQLYFQAQRDVTADLLRRAQVAGYGAIVATLDAPIQVPSLRSQRAGFQMPDHCVAANLSEYAPAEPVRPEPGLSRIFQGLMRSAPTWRDVDWLLAQTSLPVWVKGVLHPQDALDLKARGVAGLIVSNHGGRALDGAPASLHALPQIRAAVGDDLPVLFDSGIRSGTDIFKALALGADAVLIGRLQMYALSVAGALGVAHMIKLLREELEICMALAGCTTLADICQATVLPQNTTIGTSNADRH